MQSSDSSSKQQDVPTLDYATPRNVKRLGLIWVVGVVGYVFGLVALDVTGERLNRPSRAICGSSVQACAAHLRQIGQGVMLYASANEGVYPDTLADVFLAQNLHPAVFRCPHKSGGTLAYEVGTREYQAAQLASPGYDSYIYLGKGWTADRNTGSRAAHSILAYEPLWNHDGRGMNVLYGDGRVEFEGAEAAMRMLFELSQGRNPPRPGRW